MEQLRTKTEKISRINRYVKSLTVRQTDVLLEQLKRNSIRGLAEKLSTKKKSPLTMDEIVLEVKKVRKKRGQLHGSK